ncbi:MAG: helix-turn-helix domain-containing protein [Clostridiaceae bacterium]|nr:helix-turn-helix domain-containing protein [Clostridiaceae bacterium]
MNFVNNVYDSIIKGLNEAIEYEKGNLRNVKTDRLKVASLPCYRGKQIREIRTRLNLSQQVFAAVFGVSKKTVEAWESGRNIPQGPAQRMLQLMNKDEDLLRKYAIMESGNN